jgi:hypothetical protein
MLLKNLHGLWRFLYTDAVFERRCQMKTSLRRHYPDQVQGLKPRAYSQPADLPAPLVILISIRKADKARAKTWIYGFREAVWLLPFLLEISIIHTNSVFNEAARLLLHLII